MDINRAQLKQTDRAYYTIEDNLLASSFNICTNGRLDVGTRD